MIVSPFSHRSSLEVGGGGDLSYKCGQNEMFERMCAWDDQNYVMAAGTKAGAELFSWPVASGEVGSGQS